LTIIEAAPEVQGGVFVPDIPIMQVDSTTYNNVDQYVDKDDVITYVNKFDNDIIKVHDKEITIITSNGNTAVLITIIAIGFLVVLGFLLLARYLYNKMRAEKAKAE
jgi:hypothetical protein